jgi:hypothetical protein
MFLNAANVLRSSSLQGFFLILERAKRLWEPNLINNTEGGGGCCYPKIALHDRKRSVSRRLVMLGQSNLGLSSLHITSSVFPHNEPG